MKYLITNIFLTITCTLLSQTCDLNLTGYTPPANGSGLHIFNLEFISAENCGCNEFTQTDGNNCDESTSTHVQNNETVTHIVFGIHYVNEETGEDYGINTECTSNTFHPGWSYVISTAIPPNGFSTGSFTTFAINPPYSWDCILENQIEGYCWEVVIWQINLSQTAGLDDFPNDGWSGGDSFNNTQLYPDIDLTNNTIQFCPEPQCINDTIYIDSLIYDTVYIEVPIVEYIFDTITEYINLYDTLYLDNYIYDTTYVDVIYYEFVTDTITELIVQEIWVNCETGLPCEEIPYGYDCPDWTTVHIPNTFTPNNDGFNDVWYLKYDLNCWVDVEFWIYNRWGDLIYHNYGDSFDSYPYWDGSVNSGNYYVSDGVYVYTFKGRKSNSPEIVKKSGHVTVLR